MVVATNFSLFSLVLLIPLHTFYMSYVVCIFHITYTHSSLQIPSLSPFEHTYINIHLQDRAATIYNNNKDDLRRWTEEKHEMKQIFEKSEQSTFLLVSALVVDSTHIKMVLRTTDVHFFVVYCFYSTLLRLDTHRESFQEYLRCVSVF